MTRRGWPVVVLLATALIAYLVMPNDLAVPAHAAPTSSWGAGVRSGPVLSDLVHDDSGRPVAFSDEVTMPPRDLPQGHPPSADREPIWDSLAPALGRRGSAGSGTVSGGALAALRPRLDDLQILRC
ncbi:hypothetical protein OOK36_55430 [Streptomyces sp. NBC_00365]|uniref:hypothetical protein n=1 Tax=Streptomyces sp. NBC_00365 TaxID=2975726 RepID=UPI0022503CB9|nr:hypothetical protein [Streptomyces sp. NBC_00365]MCX5097648.1 hypothetical protein [Streptomyces sp. NBC_00365]